MNSPEHISSFSGLSLFLLLTAVNFYQGDIENIGWTFLATALFGLSVWNALRRPALFFSLLTGFTALPALLVIAEGMWKGADISAFGGYFGTALLVISRLFFGTVTSILTCTLINCGTAAKERLNRPE